MFSCGVRLDIRSRTCWRSARVLAVSRGLEIFPYGSSTCCYEGHAGRGSESEVNIFVFPLGCMGQ